MRILIADDEPLARRALQQLLVRQPDVAVVAECADGLEVRDALNQYTIDVALLDIRMPELSGLDVAARLGDASPLVVFVTAHEEFGVPAFERGAVDYLLKPVTQHRLEAMLARLRTRLAADRDAARYRATAGAVPPRHLDRLVARVGEREVIIPVGAVELIAADDVYAAVFAGGRRYLVRTPLDDLEESLSAEQFVRVHRSYIVPINGVAATRRTDTGIVLELRNGATVPVSRRRRGVLARFRSQQQTDRSRRER